MSAPNAGYIGNNIEAPERVSELVEDEVKYGGGAENVPRTQNETRDQSKIGNMVSKFAPMSEYAAEFFGTAILVMIGNAAGVQNSYVYCHPDYNPNQTGADNSYECSQRGVDVNIHIGWGIAVALGIYASMRVSGGHVNPAVTIASLIFNTHGWNTKNVVTKAIAYIVCQFLGAMFGALMIVLIFVQPYRSQAALYNQIKGGNEQNPYSLLSSTIHTNPLPAFRRVTSGEGRSHIVPNTSAEFYGSCFAAELIGTATVVFMLYSAMDLLKKNDVSMNFLPIIIGTTFTGIGVAFGMVSGYAMNPARDFGPRVIGAIVSSAAGAKQLSFNTPYFLVPLLAPIVGAIIGGFLYKCFVSHRRKN